MNLIPEPIPVDPLGDLRAELQAMRDALVSAYARSSDDGQVLVRAAAAKVRDRLGDLLAVQWWDQFIDDVEDSILADDAMQRVADGEPTIPLAQVAREAGLIIDPPSPNRPAVSQAPLDHEPPGPHLPEAERARLLTEAMHGVAVGAYDARILRWLARADTSTVRTVVSLIGRVRVVAPAGLQITCAHCGARIVIGHPVEVAVVADDAQRARRRNPSEGTS